jgi:hypothetical protein
MRWIGPEHLRRFEIAPRGWLDKIAFVWVLESGVAPKIPKLLNQPRQFISRSPLHPWGRLHLTGMLPRSPAGCCIG